MAGAQRPVSLKEPRLQDTENVPDTVKDGSLTGAKHTLEPCQEAYLRPRTRIISSVRQGLIVSAGNAATELAEHVNGTLNYTLAVSRNSTPKSNFEHRELSCAL